MSAPSARRFALTPWQRTGVYASVAVLWASGVAWLLGQYFLSEQIDGILAPHALMPWSMKAHGLSVSVFSVLVGSVWPVHMRGAWRARRNRAVGLCLAALCLVLALSGYLLYYGPGGSTHAWVSMLHWLLGLGVVPLLWLHVQRGRSAVHESL